jgi:hypothetical protein
MLVRMKTIPLTQGKVALVDDEDYEMLSQWKWFAWESPKSHSIWYAHTSCLLNGKRTVFSMHRLLMGHPLRLHVDHKNRDGLDNRRCNLRLATASQNIANSPSRRGSSLFKGVYWTQDRKRWTAHIKKDRQTYFLAHCRKEEDAAIYYNVAAQLFFGEFAYLNHV